MQNEYLTAGEFAKLARTTKRTVLWYANKGILVPEVVNEKGYRFYKPRQIIDFQVILLLRELNFSLEDIKKYLAKHKNLKSLFESKREVVRKEIARLEKSLHDINGYYESLESQGVLVKPLLKHVEPFEIYYMDFVGQYANIKDYCLELKSHFAEVPENAVYLTLFMDRGYKPKKANLRIGVVMGEGMKLKKSGEKAVQRYVMPELYALTYTHIGPGTLISLLWQEMAKYCRRNGYKQDTSLPFEDFELYKRTSLNGFVDEEFMEFELYLPVVTKA